MLSEDLSHFDRKYQVSHVLRWLSRRSIISPKFAPRCRNCDYPIFQRIVPLITPVRALSLCLSPQLTWRCAARGVWNLIELFTNMDLAQLATIVDVEVLPSLERMAEKDRGLSDLPAERASSIVTALGRSIEAHLSAQQEDHTES